MALTLPTGTPLTHGYFGNGHFALMPLAHGFFWCQPGDETVLLYRDDGAGTFDDALPCGAADEGDASDTIDLQDLAPAYVDANSMLLLHFNGTDASTTVTDSSPTTKTVAAASPAQIDNAQYKFGPTSGYFPAAGGTLTVTDHAGFALGAAWTIEVWVKWESSSNVSFWRQSQAANQAVAFNALSGSMYLWLDSGGGLLTCSGALPAATQTDGEWHHIAATFDGTDCRIFVDGTVIATDTNDYTMPNWAANPTVNYGGNMRGWLDELAIFDTCKYTANFTPPTRPWGYDQTNIYQYRRVAVSAAGSVSDPGPAVSVEVDSSGAIVGPVGNAAYGITAEVRAAGVIRTQWRYNATGQPATPTGFKVYRSDDGGSTYSLQSTVAYSTGLRTYYADSGALTNATEYHFKVRTYRTISGVDYEESSDEIATATADTAAPTAPTSLTVSIA